MKKVKITFDSENKVYLSWVKSSCGYVQHRWAYVLRTLVKHYKRAGYKIKVEVE